MTVMLSLGVPNSGFQKIHELMMSVGLGEAKKSKREDYLPTEITEKLCEKYNCLGTNYSELEQLSPGKMWHSLASDLMLGNLDQKEWGWSDSNSICLLNFWKEFEPQLNFLLVYTSPQAYLAEYFINNNHEANEAAASKALAIWKNYNTELLKFYLENKERSLLLNLEAALGQMANVLSKLDEKFGCQLKLDSTLFLSAENNLDCEQQLLYGHMNENLEIYNFYEELESCSDFPMYENESSSEKLYHSLNSIRKQKQKQKQTTENLETLKTKNLNLELEIQQKTNELKCQLDEKKSVEEKLISMKSKPVSDGSQEQKTEHKKLEKENELLLLQLHQVQEELETYFHKYQELASKPYQAEENKLSASHSEKKATTIDMRHFIEGQNWYHAEHDGRWAGPDHVSSLKLPNLPSGKYELEMSIVAAMSPKIIRQMKLLWNGSELPKKVTQPWTSLKAVLRRYYLLLFQNREGGPLILKSKLEIGPDTNIDSQFLGIQLPCTISPSSRGQQDTRDLGIKLCEVKVIPI